MWRMSHPYFEVKVIGKSDIRTLNGVGIDDLLPRQWDSPRVTTPAHVKDAVSLAVMQRFGGIWIDVSVVPFFNNSLLPLFYHLHGIHFDSNGNRIRKRDVPLYQGITPKNWQEECEWELQVWAMI